MLDHTVLRLRYMVGNGLRFLSRPWRQRAICPDDATTIFGCSFGGGGWHHIRRALAEFDADPSIAPAQSSLGRYLERFCPTSISSLAGVTGEEPLPLFVYPWGSFNDGASQSTKDARSSRFCGPSTAEFVDEEFRSTVRLYQEMQVHGYQPLHFPNSYIGGTWLEAMDGRRRFVVMQGNHRMAILAHLGVPLIKVRTIPQALARVKEKDIARWPLVVTGRCSTDHARRVFEMFFSEGGWHVAKLVE
jgi:hypothetical protein